MNIFIPLGGKGERFQRAGYDTIKPLIKVFDKEMILYVLDNLHVEWENDLVFVIYYEAGQYDVRTLLSARYPAVQLVGLPQQTRGAAETILQGIQDIKKRGIQYHKQCLLLDCDTFYTEDIIGMYRQLGGNAVFYTMNTESEPLYSYIHMNDQNEIDMIVEKLKISDCANTGIYCFADIDDLDKYARKVITMDIRFANEYYTSCIIDQMLQNGEIFRGIQLRAEHVFCLGTPAQLQAYVEQSFLFLFDLDGTLVSTDSIYLHVWAQILKKYNIDVTKQLFHKYIQGQSDASVLRCLLPNKHYDLLDTIASEKDTLFVQYIDRVAIIDGAVDFIRQVKKAGHKVAIVTNCNRQAAEAIVQFIRIDSWVDTLVIGVECTKSKPSPEPYMKAIHYFQSSPERAIIFEDSKTGIQSARHTSPKCLVGITSLYSKDELLNTGVDYTIDSYMDLSFTTLLEYNNMNIPRIKSYLTSSLSYLHVASIDMNPQALKGGFISDVLHVTLHCEGGDTLDCVLKLENKNPTSLSKMAKNLGLYEREYYFYDTISKYVPVCTPRFYGLVKDEHFQNIGIVMQNLLASSDFSLNLDLNQESIDVSLSVIHHLAKLHAKFWNKDLSNVFKELRKHDDVIFNPSWNDFVQRQWPLFQKKWSFMLTPTQLGMAEQIVRDFQQVQYRMSDKNLTLCHGDVKSANLFYKRVHNGTYEPYFIDWQYICQGKGVQDLVFFMIESFNCETIDRYHNIFKKYYYVKLLENGVQNYSVDEYNSDFHNSVCYFPFFVAMWFGTVNEDELMDKNFPPFFIQKLFHFLTSVWHQGASEFET